MRTCWKKWKQTSRRTKPRIISEWAGNLHDGSLKMVRYPLRKANKAEMEIEEPTKLGHTIKAATAGAQ